MTDLGNKILETLKEKHLKPTSRFRVLFNSYLWAFFAFLMVIFGSLSVSVIIFYLRNEDWALYNRAGFSELTFLLTMIPYFWIILSLIFVVLAYYNFRHTKFGYRYRFSVIVVAYFVISVVLGSGAYVLGAGERMESLFFNNNVIFYGQMMEKRQAIWNKPERGMIAGQIISINQYENELQVLDLAEKIWLVDISRIHLPPFIHLNFAERVRVFGKVISENSIEAEMIKPFFLESLKHCDVEGGAVADCVLIHHRIMKENIPQLRIIN